MTEESAPRKKRVLSPFEWILLIVAVFILLTVGLQECGVGVMKQTEDTEIIQKPHQ